MLVQENVPLAPLTTFRLGGAARFFSRVQTTEALRQSLDYARDQNLATLILGGGSNMLIAEHGFDGLVIKIELRGVELQGETLLAAAGEPWDALVARAVDAGLWGIENLSGIPGSCGAAPVQNIGAYGTEIRDTLAWVEALDVRSGEVVRLPNEDCGFGYRTSRFKQEPGRYVVLRVALRLSPEPRPQLVYQDLSEAFKDNESGRLNLTGIRQAVLAIRARKFPDLAREGTAGSFFLNPVLPAEQAAALCAQYPALPHYPAPSGLPGGKAGVKVSLAWLLDNALRLKGSAVGGARLFERQPLVLVASRDARAQDVIALAQKVKDAAKKNLNIDLEEEVRIIS